MVERFGCGDAHATRESNGSRLPTTVRMEGDHAPFDFHDGREHRTAVLVARGGASLDQIDLKVHLIPTPSLPA